MNELPDSLPSNLISVLASPSHPGNIGAVARSLKTMGLSSCRLVSPDDYPSPIASARASGALDVLNNASLYETFDEAIADCRIVGYLGTITFSNLPACDASSNCTTLDRGS